MTRPGTTDALAPVRETLLADARAEAADVLEQAQEQARQVVADAEEMAREAIVQARSLGEQEGAAAAAAVSARARREARAVVLTAQREALDRLRAQCRIQVRALGGDTDHPHRRDRLVSLASADLGPDVVVSETPDGVVAVAGSRRLNVSWDELADNMVERLGGEVLSLWAS